MKQAAALSSITRKEPKETATKENIWFFALEQLFAWFCTDNLTYEQHKQLDSCWQIAHTP